jgi:Zn-dependent peptidase ImmA (M78 family)/transcriptional regulator with XRE-family HTH domain
MESSEGKILRIAIKPELLRWARERAGRTIESLKKAFPKYDDWEKGRMHPTLKQLERLAKALRVPLGFLFLEAPPEEPLPIPDFRTMPQARLSRPSPELLDTIYSCQQRQEWYRNYLITMGEVPLPFVGRAGLSADPSAVAAEIRATVKLDLQERAAFSTWTQALNRFIVQVEQSGILVMVNSVVGNNTHRPLDTEEFRGFTLVDDLAPLIFINGADTLAAKTFTLAHELAHIWLGESGVSDARLETFPEDRVERWCNQVAAEVLVPRALLAEKYDSQNELSQELNRLARIFKVSTLVILRRLADTEFLDWNAYQRIYEKELERVLAYERLATEEGGGNFYYSLSRRVSKRFAQALISSTMEGQTLFRDAFAMLGVSKVETFRKFAQELGVG